MRWLNQRGRTRPNRVRPFNFLFAIDRVKALAPQHPEWAYDRASSIGRLDKALDEAQSKGWTVVDMKTDWKIIFPFEKR
jgi:hypothetical protein